MATGKMPRLKALCDRGLTGRTRYETPYLLTPQMWATILTGRGAGSHGLFDYWQRDHHGLFRETRGGDIDGPRLWDEMAARSLSGGYVNVPMTYPPPRTPGFAISGQDAPGAHRSMAFPPALFDQAQAKFGRYRHKDIFPGPLSKSDYGRALPREVARQADLFEWLAMRADTDFLMLYSSGTAFAQHYFWSDMAEAQGDCQLTIENTYAACDALIGRVVDALGPSDTLMVISECGAGPIAAGVRLNAWLQQQGFLARGRRGSSPAARLATAVRSAAPKIIPRNAFHLVNQHPLKAWIQSRISEDRLDWSRTTAFHRGKGEGNIYINLRGRDRRGVVDPADYEKVRQDIIDRLADLRDPATGAPAVAAAHRREDLVEGPHVASAPDIIVEWKNFAYMPAEGGDMDGPLFGARIREYMSWPTSGSHRRLGFLMAQGVDVRAGRLAQPVDLRDLAPTWIDMLGGGAPSSMEGRSRALDFAARAVAD